MYSIDGTAMTDYGLHIANQHGFLDLPQSQKQFFTSYFTEGFQITKRKGNTLDLVGYIVASDMSDFQTKTTALFDVFKAIQLRSIELDLGAFNCFSRDGFKIERVRSSSSGVVAMFKMKLIIVG